MGAKRTAFLLATLVAALALAACGSSGPSKSDYIAKADAVCTRGSTQIKAVPAPTLTGLPARQILTGLSSYVDRVLPVAQGVINQLKALKQPSKDQALLQRYFSALDTAVKQLQALSDAAKRGDIASVRSGAAALSSTQPDALARQYGFKRCGGTSGTG